MVNIGIIGTSEGNGHPYSFSCIINGYDHDKLKTSAWTPIFEYISKRDKSEIGVPGMHVSHVWTQSLDESRRIAETANIENICGSVSEMSDEVDAVIIARDDWESHLELAIPFLESGKSVFVDKPLTLDLKELKIFAKYLNDGKLMSTSGLRYAQELDDYRWICKSEAPVFISGLVINDWGRYGTHLLDAIYSGMPWDVTKVYSTGKGECRTTILTREEGGQITLSCLGPAHKIFSLRLFFKERMLAVDLRDNFTAFKRTLCHFRDFVETGRPVITPSDTVNLMRTLIAGEMSLEQDREVSIDELCV